MLVASAKADTTKVREKQKEVLIAEAAKKGSSEGRGYECLRACPIMYLISV